MAEFTSQTIRKPYSKLFAAFFSGLLVTTAGLYLGQYVPPALMLPLTIVEIGMIIMMMFVRKRQSIGYLLMYSFMFISGLTLFTVISYYVSLLGATAVLQAFAVTTISFGAMAVYTMVSKRDFTFLGNFLFLGLIALVLIGLFNVFFPLPSMTMLMYSGFGILIFIGYTLYDFSRLTVHGFTDEDIPIIVVSIYLDFINLFQFILQFMGFSSRD
ncbi:Bax inhibitor-1/YccA family protein [Sporolactobacillus sp. THM7-7]|nr:Bax inhibitor-1/YccA family protein [Sporolactobacillus sp. THM7-7]